jgi:L-fuconolactonase
VVGWLDLRAEPAELAAQLQRFAGHPKLVGVRHVLHDEPAAELFMQQDSFRRGVAALGPAGLAYDLLLFPQHLQAALRLARDFPHQRFVLDHIGNPSISMGTEQAGCWLADLQALAACPNVHCKLSGMVTKASWRKWQEEDFRPFLDAVKEAFGPERIMVGSDWPVCLLAADYEEAIGIVRRWAESALSPEEAKGVMGENARAFYKRR